MILRSSLRFLILAAVASSLLVSSSAQTTARNLPVPQDFRITRIAFSSDGRVLRALGTSSESQLVRAVTYDAATGRILHVINFAMGTEVLSTTSDGRMAIVANQGVQTSLVDTETGKAQPLPTAWNNEDEEVELSADGRLISIYSETGDGLPMKVTVYAWPSKTLVATQTSDYIAAGGTFGGGITPDGHAIQFESNRAGKRLVDLHTGRAMASFGPDTVLSPSGEWAVEMPNMSFKDENAPSEVLIKDGKIGATRGRIDLSVPEEIAYGQMTGAFCGNSGRFILASVDGVAAYAIPSGMLLASFLPETWRDPTADLGIPVTVACSPNADRIAVLSGHRLSLHTVLWRGILEGQTDQNRRRVSDLIHAFAQSHDVADGQKALDSLSYLSFGAQCVGNIQPCPGKAPEAVPETTRLWLEFFAAIDPVVSELAKKLSTVYTQVFPPGDAGMGYASPPPPSSISDPALRQRYEEAIAANERNRIVSFRYGDSVRMRMAAGSEFWGWATVYKGDAAARDSIAKEAEALGCSSERVEKIRKVIDAPDGTFPPPEE